MEAKIYDTAVIGAGSAGVMATLRSVLNNDDTLLFTGHAKDKKKSRAMWVRKVENIPGFLDHKRGIEDPNKQAIDFIQNGEFADKLTLLKNTGVESLVKNEQGLFELKDNKGNTHLSRFVILATGVMDVQPHIDGSIEPIFKFANSQQIDYCLRCDGHHILGKETSVIGHTDSAAWVAIMLHERYAPPTMTILTNGEKPIFSDDTRRLIELYNIEVEIESITDLRGEVATGFEGYVLESGKYVHSDFAFISLGMIVYNDLAKNLGAQLDQRGFVTTNTKGESSVEGLYIAGDLRAGVKKQIYTAWDTAVDSADDINMKLRSSRRKNLLTKFEQNNYQDMVK